MKTYGVYVLIDCSNDFIIVDNAGILCDEHIVVFCPDGRALEVKLAHDHRPVPDFGKVKSWWHYRERTDVLPQIGSLVCGPSSFVMSYWNKYWRGDFNTLIQKTLTRYDMRKYDMPVPCSPHPALWTQIPCLNRELSDLDMLKFELEDL